jgi:hypothetical protein
VCSLHGRFFSGIFSAGSRPFTDGIVSSWVSAPVSTSMVKLIELDGCDKGLRCPKTQ